MLAGAGAVYGVRVSEVVETGQDEAALDLRPCVRCGAGGGES